MKNLALIILLILTLGCQREKANEVGVGYNKSLIIPPSNDLPEPGALGEERLANSSLNDNDLVNVILEQTEANKADESIIDKIDNETGYDSDENLFQWLFKGKSKR